MDKRITAYRMEDGLWPGTLYEAADTLAWSRTRMLVKLGYGKWIRRVRRLEDRLRRTLRP